jgi:hypothetical protein
MGEQFPSPEHEITREEAMVAYKRFVDQGATSPDSLNPDDPEVQEAKKFFGEWQAREGSAFLKATFYIDAGFTDKAYLEEVLQRLRADADTIEDQPASSEKIKLKQQYAREITKIMGLLRKAQ